MRVLLESLTIHVYPKAKKCSFHVSISSFLGFVFSEGQVGIDLLNVRAVQDLPVLTSTNEVQRILEFADLD